MFGRNVFYAITSKFNNFSYYSLNNVKSFKFTASNFIMHDTLQVMAMRKCTQLQTK